MTSNQELAGKTVLVTGAGTGVGRSVIRQVAASGGRSVAMGRRAGPLVEAIVQAGCTDSISYVGDAGIAADAEGAVGAALAHFGRLDAVIACAGTLETGTLTETADDSWERVLHSNLGTAFVTARAAMPALRRARGALVFVASTASVEAIPGACGYMVAKHALIGLMRSIALDFGPEGVRANAVCPGWIMTPMADDELAPLMARDGLSLDDAYARVTSFTPLRRPAPAASVADLCCYLASDRASMTTGSCFMIDGGSTIVSAPSLRM